MATVRELLTTWGFNVDFRTLEKMDNKIMSIREDVRSVGKGLNEVARDVTSFGTRLTAFVTAPVVGASVGLLKLAGDAAEVRSKFDAVFKEYAADTRVFVDQTSSAVGRSKIDLEDWLASLQDTFVPLGFARKEATELSKRLTTLAIDIASFNNKSDPDTIRDLQSAIVGNHETVRKYGIVITQATLDQELMNMGISDGVKNATEAQKAQARLNIIINGTTDAQGDATRTALSFNNQLKKLRAESKDLGINLGEILIPKAREIVSVAIEWVHAFKGLSAGNASVIFTIAGIIAVIGPLILILGLVLSSIVAVIRSMIFLRAVIISLRASVIALQAAAFAIPLAIAAIVTAIVAVGEDFYRFFKGQKSAIGEWLGSWEEVKQFFSDLGDSIGKFFSKWAGKLPLIGRFFKGDNSLPGPSQGISNGQIAPGATLRGRNKTVNVDSQINITVPDGMSEGDINNLNSTISKTVREEQERLLRDALTNYPENE